jgi:hypothetical protein
VTGRATVEQMARHVSFGAWLVIAASVPGCYRTPSPVCGFVCGLGGSCPDNYTCFADDNRCHLNGAGAECETAIDGGFTLDVGPDALIDAPPLPVANIEAFTPVNLQLDVPVNVLLSITFDVPVEAADYTAASLTSISDTPVLYTQSSGPGTINVGAYLQLTGSTDYTVTLSPAFLAPSGYVIVGTSWSFTTATDTIVPHLVDEMPVNGDTDVPDDTTIDLYFDELVENLDTTSLVVTANGTPVDGTVSFINADPYALYRFTPTVTFPAAATIEYTLSSAITDASTNALAPLDYTFVTQ